MIKGRLVILWNISFGRGRNVADGETMLQIVNEIRVFLCEIEFLK